MTPNETRYFIVGVGAVGASLARALHAAGAAELGVSDTDPERLTQIDLPDDIRRHAKSLPRTIRRFHVVILAVGDGALAGLARDAAARDVCGIKQAWLHTAGAVDTTVFAPLQGRIAGAGVLHPALVFPPNRQTPIPAGTRFGVSGDPPALAAAGTLLDALGCRAVPVDEARRGRYHAANVLASNGVAGLLHAAQVALVSCGLTRTDAEQMALQLARSALERISAEGLEQALSGPIRRRDHGTITRHLEALADTPQTRHLYLAVSRAIVDLAEASTSREDETLTAISRLLDDAR